MLPEREESDEDGAVQPVHQAVEEKIETEGKLKKPKRQRGKNISSSLLSVFPSKTPFVKEVVQIRAELKQVGSTNMNIEE